MSSSIIESIYNPKVVNEDYLVEDIIQRGYINERIEYQDSKLDFDYYDILQKRGGEINVEAYKKMFSKQRKDKKRTKND